MESSSSNSSFSEVVENEFDVDYIIGKRIRYGGVSNFSMQCIDFNVVHVSCDPFSDFGQPNLYNERIFFLVLLFRLNIASNGKTILKMKAHGSRSPIYRANSYWMNMKNYMQTMSIRLYGIQCR